MQLMANIVCSAALDIGLDASLIPNYGLEQRGGSSLAFVQLSDAAIVYPKFSRADMVVIMSAPARKRIANYTLNGTQVKDIQEYAAILAQKNIKPNRVNMFFLGLVAREFEKRGLALAEKIEANLAAYLAHKDGFEENIRVFKEGFANETT